MAKDISKTLDERLPLKKEDEKKKKPSVQSVLDTLPEAPQGQDRLATPTALGSVQPSAPHMGFIPPEQQNIEPISVPLTVDGQPLPQAQAPPPQAIPQQPQIQQPPAPLDFTRPLTRPAAPLHPWTPTPSDLAKHLSPQALAELEQMEKARRTATIPQWILDNHPEAVDNWLASGPITAGETIRDTQWSKLLPFSPVELVLGGQLLQAVNRLKKDDYRVEETTLPVPAQLAMPAATTRRKLSPQQQQKKRKEDIDLVSNFILDNTERQIRGKTIGGAITEGVMQLPAFMTEFAATGGTATAARTAVQKAITSKLKKIVGKKAAKTLVNTAGWLAGSAARTGLMPHRVGAATVENLLPEGMGFTDKGRLIVSKAGDEPFKAFYKGIADVMIENLSEASGEGISRLREGLTGAFRSKKPSAAVNRLFTRSGYDGFIEELGEEQLGKIMRLAAGVTTNEEFLNSMSGRNLLIEAGILAVPAVGRRAAGKVADIRQPAEPAKPQFVPIDQQELKPIDIPITGETQLLPVQEAAPPTETEVAPAAEPTPAQAGEQAAATDLTTDDRAIAQAALEQSFITEITKDERVPPQGLEDGQAARKAPPPGLPPLQEGVSTRPDLANPGITPEQRHIVDLQDQYRNLEGKPVPVTNMEQYAESQKRMEDKNYTQEVESKLLEGQMVEGFDAVDEISAAQTYRNLANEAIDDLDSTDKLDKALQAADGWRDIGTKAGQVLQARRDQLMSPSDRMMNSGARVKENVVHSIIKMPDTLRKKIKAARKKGDKEKAKGLVTEWRDNAKKMVETLKEKGIDLKGIEKRKDVTDKERLIVIHAIRNLYGEYASWWDKLQETYRNSLMWAPDTQIVNAMGGGGYAIYDALFVQPLARTLRLGFGENIAAANALRSRQAFSRSFQNLMDTFWYEMPAFEVKAKMRGLKAAEDMEIHSPPAIKGPKGRAMRLPQNTNSSVDQFFRTLHAHGIAAEFAVKNARKEGIKPYTKEMSDYVKREVDNVSSKSWSDAIESGESHRVGFVGESSYLEQFLINLRRKFPVLGITALPFIKTMVQITGQGAMHGPLGTGAMIIRTARRKIGTRKPKPYTMRKFSVDAARQIIGYGSILLLWDMVENEKITGPADYERTRRAERKTKEANRPAMHFKIGDKWYSYRRAEPFSSIIGQAVVIIDRLQRNKKIKEAIAQGKDEELMEKLDKKQQNSIHRIVSMLSDQTYMKTIGDMYKAYRDPEEYGERLFTNWAASWMPNIFRSGARGTDLYVRETRPRGEEDERPATIEQIGKKMLPVGYPNQKPKVTFFGRDIKRVGSGPLSPFTTQMLWPFKPRKALTGLEGRVMDMIYKYNLNNPDQYPYNISEMSDKVRLPAKKGQREGELVEMNGEEWYVLNKLVGLRLKALLTKQELLEDAYKYNYLNPTNKDIEEFDKMLNFARNSVRVPLRLAIIAKHTGRTPVYDTIMRRLKNDITKLERNKKYVNN